MYKISLLGSELDLIIAALNLTIDEVPENPEGTAYELVSKLQQIRSVNESIQITDKVKYKNETGFVIGEIGGQLIVQVQGNSYLVDPKHLKECGNKHEATVKPPMKFDEKTQALLFEQYVKCGLYMGNVPVKMNDCYVKYSSWDKATSDQMVKVIIEGNNTFMNKSQIRILENINDFANEDNYIPGVIIDETNEEVIENILLNAIDYSNALGNADSIRIIKTTETGEQEMQSVPKSSVRTLAV